MSSKPKQSAESKELERIAVEREKQLNVENARQTTKAFSDNIAFRKKLRGIFSLLSNNFKGFPRLGINGPLGAAGTGRSGGSGGSAGGGVAGGGTSARNSGGGLSAGGSGSGGGGSVRNSIGSRRL